MNPTIRNFAALTALTLGGMTAAHGQTYVFDSNIGNGRGGGIGQLSSPDGVAVDGSGNVFVADNGNSRIEKFNSSGFAQSIGNGQGSGSGQLYFPAGITLDGSGNLFVADEGNNRIVKFDAVPEPGSVAFFICMATVGAGVLRKRQRR